MCHSDWGHERWMCIAHRISFRRCWQSDRMVSTSCPEKKVCPLDVRAEARELYSLIQCEARCFKLSGHDATCNTDKSNRKILSRDGTATRHMVSLLFFNVKTYSPKWLVRSIEWMVIVAWDTTCDHVYFFYLQLRYSFVKDQNDYTLWFDDWAVVTLWRACALGIILEFH